MDAETRAVLEECAEALREVKSRMPSVTVFVKSRQRINRPTGEEWWDEAVATANAALASLRELLEKPPASRWIPVGEEEPQDGRWLVGWFAPAGFGKGLEWCSQTARRLDGAWLPHYKPTHWRPLPPPPRGG